MTGDSLARATSRPQTGRPAPIAKVLALPASPAPTAQQGAASATPRLRRLTAADMATKREKGECFNCTEKFSQAHLDVCPMKGLFLLELDAATPDDLDEEKPLICLNAITSISVVETMTLHVHLLNFVVEALVDLGSTHSFISADTASRLHLQSVYRLGLQVTVANGDRVASAGICRDVHIIIDKEEFILDFFIIPLDGYEMVLGCSGSR
jgi:hypothetical protein